MNDTLINNICLGLDLHEIDHSNLNKILETTGLKEIISSLKDGINTKLGDQV